MRNLLWKIRSSWYSFYYFQHAWESKNGKFFLKINGGFYVFQLEIGKFSICWEA